MASVDDIWNALCRKVCLLANELKKRYLSLIPIEDHELLDIPELQSNGHLNKSPFYSNSEGYNTYRELSNRYRWVSPHHRRGATFELGK